MTSSAECTNKTGQRIVTAIIVVMAGCLCAFLYDKAQDDTVWSTEKDSTHTEIARRVAARGSVTSLASSIPFGALTGVINSMCGVHQNTSSTLMSMIYANVVGYMLDVAYGSEVGMGLTSQNAGKGMRYAVSSLSTTNFFRYVLTVLLDVFISSILVDRLSVALTDVPESMPRLRSIMQCSPMTTFVPTFATVVVSFITFHAYTNMTRFQFAIRDDTFPTTPEEFADRVERSYAYAHSDYDKTAVDSALAELRGLAAWADYTEQSLDDVKLNGLLVNDVQTDKETATSAFAKDVSRELLTEGSYMDSSLFALATTIAAVCYLTTPVAGGKGVHAPAKKLALVMMTIALIFTLVMSGTIDSPPMTSSYAAGMAAYVVFTVVCVFGTFSTSALDNKYMLASVLCAGMIATLVVASMESLPPLPEHVAKSGLVGGLSVAATLATFTLAVVMTKKRQEDSKV